ncbi:MAG: bifunctional 2-methylcitrate dehydratase/aconitate hydratase [Meiothermus sp.]|uniref:bifunctional 2-methylcitrate dehydratase/aconitate hydratase n=1 Tax=Meiothermus sp. TaxID=1955249 RepID=UPI00262E630E|nr:bifunctional 2-methylcitrate dehydratase/aconitate hydratase [Meiothermus sp.]MCS7058141.1 bifunctional 2-methylcitrate dehydratase/aconitate hydratase [Meiothermus sp.]
MERDRVLQELTRYLVAGEVGGEKALFTARLALADALGCLYEALTYPEAVKLVGPLVPGTHTPFGARVPGTPHALDPMRAAFSLTALIRWLDYNDTWLAKEWGHPSDNLGAILALGDHLSRLRRARGEAPYRVGDLLALAIKAYEIQGVLALENALNRVGLDHVHWVKVASAGVAALLYGGGEEAVFSALSNAFLDGAALRTYRHYPNTGPRKSWAAADATARGVFLAWAAMKGEPGYATALSAPTWGFEAVVLKAPVVLARPLGSYVMENVLFKVAYPAEFHGQTAVEAALALHGEARALLGSPERLLEEAEEILIETQEAGKRIIDKPGPFQNPADRDHSLQYMTAVALLLGELRYEHYLEPTASDPRIPALIAKMRVVENPEFSRAYLDPERRAIPNRVRVRLRDGRVLERLVEYPLGHPRRREESLPFLRAKLERALHLALPRARAQELLYLLLDDPALPEMPVDRFLAALAPEAP